MLEIAVGAILAALLIAACVWLMYTPQRQRVEHPERFHVGMRMTAGGRAFVITRIEGNVVEWRPVR